jgi:microcystin-dependent protein
MDPFLGQLMCVGFNFAPQGWATCEGQLLSIASNSALFALLGTTYGGDGRTTFGLPDLRGRVPLGRGNGPGIGNFTWGEKSGAATTSILTTNLPPHNHPLSVSSADATQGAATAGASIATPGMTSGRTFTPGQGFNTATPNTVLNTASIGNAGSGTPINNMQPYLGLYWIIALQGIFPSRP